MTIAPDAWALFLRAAGFAADRHRDQRRKGNGEPYINHPLYVARILAETGGIAEVAVLAAAVLHDTIEDTGATRAELAAAFGDDIADLVVEVTDDGALPKLERKMRQVQGAASLSPRARLVRLADKIANVEDMHLRPPAWPLERRKFYLQWSEMVVDPIRGTHPALEARFDAVLAAAVAALAAEIEG